MKYIKIITLLILTVLLSFKVFSQENRKTTAQFTFAYPVGSNGKEAIEIKNNFSFNLLWGVNGGLNGAEIGSIFNYNKGDVSGVQIAGVVNINERKTKGTIISGVVNVCRDTNIGVLVSGVVNYSNHNSSGLQISSVNIVRKQFNGTQIGVINYSKKMRGFQLGIINVVDSNDGVLPIGMFSVVRKGKYEFELAGGDMIFSNFNFKMGVDRFYSVYKIGFSTFKNKPICTYGIGIGSEIKLNDKSSLSIDITTNKIIYDNNWDVKLNNLNKTDINYRYKLTNKFSVFAGTSLNIYSTDEKNENKYEDLNVPYTFYTREENNIKHSIWFGANAGISLKL